MPKVLIADKLSPAELKSAQEAAVLAYSLATSTISILLQLVLGFACIRRATALGMAEVPPEETTRKTT